ncbi:DUF6888 family protein [Synechocystis sp. PCC 7509]|uniref:DUF6888 family protein n=1 Tax=Synechocystis sp. PCC 7509 TaxID=927677 RepID=UPI00048E276C
MPTLEQGIMTIIVCQMLSNLFLDIVLFRYDNLTKEVYILASKDIQIKIPSNGRWEFIND